MVGCMADDHTAGTAEGGARNGERDGGERDGGERDRRWLPQFGPWRGLGDEELLAALPKLGDYPVAGLVRRGRRLADLSQRQLALLARVAPSTVGKVEAGRIMPSLGLFQRLLAAAELALVVVDRDGRLVLPMGESEEVRDGAQRRYPSHLDTILEPRYGEWWGDVYGLARPPETFARSRLRRDRARRYSQWWTRPGRFRGVPEPPNPHPRRPAGPVDYTKVQSFHEEDLVVEEWDEDFEKWQREEAAGRSRAGEGRAGEGRAGEA